MVEKKFKGYLTINWRNGAMKICKKKPKKTGPFEVPVEIDINLITPDDPKITVKGTIIIPEIKAKEIFIASLGEEENDEE